VGLRDGLVQLGYHENKDFVLGVRFTQGDNTALPGAAQELIEAKADLLFADSNITAKALQQVSSDITIVFVAVENPVIAGHYGRAVRLAAQIFYFIDFVWPHAMPV
jgi:ABC-type uncharacterized transport system substrate-binding protein